MVTGIGSVATAATVPQQLGNTNMGTLVNSTQMAAAEPVKRPSDNRRSNKPIMEKRRRARINNCLNELKTLILDAMKKDPARHSKLEKADILEMTVKHLENLQRQQSAMSQATDPNVMNKFKAGFTECANEVGRFPGLDPQMKRRLLQHLSNCINGVKTTEQLQQQQQTLSQQHQQQQQQQQQGSVQVHILPSPPSSPTQQDNNNNNTNIKIHQLQQQQQQQHPAAPISQITATSNGYFLTNGTGAGLQLIPTKLANGNIAFVLPQQIPTVSPVPMLVPIPTRTSSTGSAASSTSSSYERINREHTTSPYHAPPSPANSYEAMDCQTTVTPLQHHHQQQQQQQQQHLLQQQQQHSLPQTQHHMNRSYSPAPLSLVMRKTCDADQMMKDDEKPWRPW